MIVLIINGAPRSGKDTFINILTGENPGKVIRYSSIDWIKQQALNLGWDGIKDAKGRQFLSDLKNACTNYADIPFKKITERILSSYNRYSQEAGTVYFCTCVREPEEISKIVRWCNENKIPCHPVLIRRKEAEQKALDKGFISSGDIRFMEYSYPWFIYNDGSLEEFITMIKELNERMSA